MSKGMKIFISTGFVLALVIGAWNSGLIQAKSLSNVITVTNTADTGPGSLRDAIINAPTGATINFDPVVFGSTKTITLTSSSLTIAKNLILQGPGVALLAIDGNNSFPVFTVNSGTVKISGLKIQHGYNADQSKGGGLSNAVGAMLTIEQMTFWANSSGSGGGIQNLGTLVASNVTFAENTANNLGGGIHNKGILTATLVTFTGNVVTSRGWGGGLLNEGISAVTSATFYSNTADGQGGAIYSNATLTLTQSAIINNTATVSDGGGGGIFAFGKTAISNSTIAGNRAAWGGGLYAYGGAAVVVGNSTIAGNWTYASGYGGGLVNNGANLVLGSNIVYGNSASSGPDIGGTLTSLGNNIVGNNANASGFVGSDQLSVNPKLNPLADNGGASQTMALQTGSPAIGLGNCNLPSPALTALTDQRDLARKTTCDVGAYESDAMPATVSINYDTGKPGSFFTLTGAHFPVSSSLTIVVNTVVLSNTLTTDANGAFVLILSTSQADVGIYALTASVNPTATTQFTLDANAPLRAQDGVGPLVNVPAGIAYHIVYLPLVKR